MPDLDASLKCPRLDATIVLKPGSPKIEDAESTPHKSPRAQPIFCLASLNPSTAPSAEVRWSQLLALSLAPEGEPVLVVGRAQECGVRLNDPRSSQRHFEIIARRKALAYECILLDRSSNGTSVNGAVVGRDASRLLHSGDEICVLPADKVGDDEMIAFLFRNTTEVLSAPEEVKRLELDELILCPICMQAMYKCVSLAPCSHNFCMSCLSGWMTHGKECPVCRRPFMAIMKNHPMDAVIEAFLEATPELRRSPEDLHDMDERDKLRLGSSGKLVRDICSIVPASRPPAGSRHEPARLEARSEPAGGARQALRPRRTANTSTVSPTPAMVGSRVCAIQ
mmetsp:Transcript_118823/g.341120  ORF Transcript_118823/g.341120 Transcript_118823/m.341120 type:complete len:338 (+) Transcript_118823:171-1184(+)